VVDRFGISKPMAAALVVIGVAVAFAVVVAVTDARPQVADAGSSVVVVDAGPALVVDSGVAAVALVVDAGSVPIVDAGAVVVAPVFDAGGVSPLVDAGSAVVVAPPVVDAGTRVKIVDAGPRVVVPSVVDAGPKAVVAPADPLAGYANHLKAAEAATKRGEFGRSVRSYKAALAIEKDSIEAHLGLGNAYYELDNLAAALFHLERARALAPKDPQVFVHLGAVYQSSGRKADAVSAYERYLDLAPDGKFARDVRGILRGLKN
jgi:hypothetical protein